MGNGKHGIRATNACGRPSLTVSGPGHVYLVFTSERAEFCRQNLMHGQFDADFRRSVARNSE